MCFLTSLSSSETMATVRKKVDNRIRVQIENGVALQHRSIFVVVGDRGRDQVIFPFLFSQANVSVLIQLYIRVFAFDIKTN